MSESKRQQWEYYCIDRNDLNETKYIMDRLNELGNEGWECYQVVRYQINNPPYAQEYHYFKRPKVEESTT